MRAFHLAVALLAFVAFLATGLVMHFGHDHLRDTEPALRSFYRSRHVYILLASLVHAALGARAAPASRPALAGSVLTTVATVGLVVAFFTEDTEPALRSPVSTLSLYAITAGVACHVVAGVIESRAGPEAPR